MSDLSGEASIRFAVLFGTRAFSRALSVRAAWADWMAADAFRFGREVTLGDDGFNGSGGGARSGSELSHLLYAISNVLEDVYICARVSSLT
jgi:hypothetical protein